jgi:hypothetical protein
MGFVHLLKLSVGSESVEDHESWQADYFRGRRVEHVTRMWPKREEEILAGGSLYWVVKGLVLCRQRIIGLEERQGADGIARCAIILDAEVVRTEAQPKRAFQGWRYLDPKDAPRDVPKSRAVEGVLPQKLVSALAEIGLR